MSLRGALGVIPARAAATRFPGKLLAPLRGRTVLEHVWLRAKGCAALERLVIATDDDTIARAALAFGAEVVRTRQDHASGTDRVAEVARLLPHDWIVNVQGDEPLVDPLAIAAALVPLRVTPGAKPGVAPGAASGPAADAPGMVTLACRETDSEAFHSPDVVKVVIDARGDALYFSRAPIGPASPFLRHVGLYAYRREVLDRLSALPPSPLERAEKLEQLRALEHGIRIRVIVTPYASRGVDTPADLAALERDWETLRGTADPGGKENPR